jgi:hypothetical protein
MLFLLSSVFFVLTIQTISAKPILATPAQMKATFEAFAKENAKMSNAPTNVTTYSQIDGGTLSCPSTDMLINGRISFKQSESHDAIRDFCKHYKYQDEGRVPFISKMNLSTKRICENKAKGKNSTLDAQSLNDLCQTSFLRIIDGCKFLCYRDHQSSENANWTPIKVTHWEVPL